MKLRSFNTRTHKLTKEKQQERSFKRAKSETEIKAKSSVPLAKVFLSILSFAVFGKLWQYGNVFNLHLSKFTFPVCLLSFKANKLNNYKLIFRFPNQPCCVGKFACFRKAFNFFPSSRFFEVKRLFLVGASG